MIPSLEDTESYATKRGLHVRGGLLVPWTTRWEQEDQALRTELGDIGPHGAPSWDMPTELDEAAKQRIADEGATSGDLVFIPDFATPSLPRLGTVPRTGDALEGAFLRIDGMPHRLAPLSRAEPRRWRRLITPDRRGVGQVLWAESHADRNWRATANSLCQSCGRELGVPTPENPVTYIIDHTNGHACGGSLERYGAEQPPVCPDCVEYARSQCSYLKDLWGDAQLLTVVSAQPIGVTGLVHVWDGQNFTERSVMFTASDEGHHAFSKHTYDVVLVAGLVQELLATKSEPLFPEAHSPFTFVDPDRGTASTSTSSGSQLEAELVKHPRQRSPEPHDDPRGPGARAEDAEDHSDRRLR